MIATSLRIARGTAGRLASSALAVVLGTAFVAAVLLGGTLLERTAAASVAAPYVGADVVVAARGNGNGDGNGAGDAARLTPATLDRVSGLPAVAGTRGLPDGFLQILAGAREQYAALAATTASPELQTAAPSSGARPNRDGEVALSSSVANRLGVGVGARVQVRSYAGPDAADTAVRVVGLLDDGSLGSGTVLATPDQALRWTGGYAELLAVGRPGVSPTELRDQTAAALGPAVTVQTAQERSRAAVAGASGGVDVLTGVVLAFAGLAMVVAAVVIANTFAVLVAQRSRQLALLRCLGATTREVRRGLVVEAALLGLVASLLGTALGVGLAELAAAVLSRAVQGVSIPGSIGVRVSTIAVPVVLGVLATVAATRPAARAATRVSPLAALRPEPAPDRRSRASRLRTVLAVVMMLAGAAGLLGGAALAGAGSLAGLPLAMLGGLVSFLGVLVGALLVVPPVVALLGALVTRVSGAGAARLAAANALRNPRRTTTTSAALLVGVTLVSLVTVGASSTRSTMDGSLDSAYPVDLTVGADLPGPQRAGVAATPEPALPPGVLPAVQGVRGVSKVVPLRTTSIVSAFPVGQRRVSVQGVDAAAAAGVVADPRTLAALRPGTVVVPETLAADLGLVDGRVLELPPSALRLTVRTTTLPGTALVVTDRAMTELAPAAPTARLWVSIDAQAAAADVVDDARDAVGAASGGASVQVTGAAAERAVYQRVIDALLLVVVGLLAVAVLIALIGVANTLALSVVERTGESALLRALGLTRGQLRGMLALEGALVAAVGALLGVALGTIYGWAGTAALLGGAFDGVSLDLPWTRLALVVAVAVLAGLVASVLPARRAARTPPVAALAD